MDCVAVSCTLCASQRWATGKFLLSLSDYVREEYRAFVRRILSTQWSGTIRLSPDADEIRREYQGYIEKKLGDDWENMRDWGGKLTGAMVRIAADARRRGTGKPNRDTY